MYKQLFWNPLDNITGLGLIIVLLWSLVWKGLALWKSARASQKYWFMALMVVNTVGILEIIYLAFVNKKTKTTK